MRRLTALRAEIDQWRGLAKRISDQSELLELSPGEEAGIIQRAPDLRPETLCRPDPAH